MNLSSLLNRKRIIGIFVALILLTAIPATLLLTKSSQDIRQRASFENQSANLKGEASVNGILYIDSNKDGAPQNNETRLEHITLNLRDQASENIINQAVSDENGYYGFTNLDKNSNYAVEVVTRDSYLGLDTTKKTISFTQEISLREDFRFEFAAAQSLSTIDDIDLDVNQNGTFDKGDIIAIYQCARETNCQYNKADVNHDGIRAGSDDINIAVRRYNKIDSKKI